MFTIPTLRLQDGITIPQIGYGTWPISDPNAERVVATAIATGYRLIDTAAAYENEAGVGKGIRASGVSRKEIFLTTKLRDRDHGYKRTLEACKRSIQILDVDYLDLYLIHWPNPWKNHFVESWHALEDLQQEKLVRTIGVSNFKPAHIDRLISERETLPAVNQIQLEPRIGRVALREYNPRRGIVTQAWSPLGRAGDLLQEPTILSIAERHECTPAQVVLAWNLALGLVTIPKAASETHMGENLAAVHLRLTEQEVSDISALDRGESAAIDSDLLSYA